MSDKGLRMKYFVLKPAGVSPYARASRIAMRHYAKAIYAENPELSDELRLWADREAHEAMDADGEGKAGS